MKRGILMNKIFRIIPYLLMVLVVVFFKPIPNFIISSFISSSIYDFLETLKIVRKPTALKKTFILFNPYPVSGNKEISFIGNI